MNGNSWKWGWLLIGMLAMQPSLASEADERQFQIEYEHIGFVVDEDGSYAETRARSVKVLDESALDYAKDASVGYSTSIQQAVVIEAYTLKADGRRVEVPPSNYQINTRAGQQGDSPVYSDRTTLTVVFPDLAVGDTTVFAYRLTASVPMFEGHFSVIESFNPAQYYGDVRVSIDAPERIPSRHQAWQMEQAGDTLRGDRRLVEWRWQNRKPVGRESLRDTVFNVERYPGYAFSTFSSYAEIAQAYGARANAKAAPTPRIRALADEVAGDADAPREVAKRLYEWVSRTITYAGNCIGLGAVVPRDLDVVLDNRMGDCKDHATLLQALLAAKGIDSTQALINAGGTYTLPATPVASVVNHVITYIPALDLYLDSTATTVPFGSLPPSATGKPVLLVDGHRDGMRTPAQETGRDGQRLTTVLRIKPDGSVSGTQRVELRGSLAVAARDQFRGLPATEAARLVKRYFQQSSLSATGSIRYPDPKPMLEEFAIDADFEVAGMFPVPGGIQVQPWFVSFAPVAGLMARNIGDAEQPAGESNCGGIHSEEEYLIEFPDTVRIVAMPDDVSVEQGSISYAATHVRQGNSIRIVRSFNDRTPGPVCSAEYNAAYSELMRQLLPGLRSQIVYLQADERI